MRPRRYGAAPIIWRCPGCGYGVTSRYARKTHICAPLKEEVTPGVVAGGRS
jgi:hypothetical protein